MTHPLEDENRRLRTALEECANDLEAELLHRYGSPAHPAMQRQFDRDFSTVVDARAALAAEPASGEAERADKIADEISAEIMARSVPPPPPTQGEEERARTVLMRLRDPDEQELDVVAAALRQRADEATRVENERIMKLLGNDPAIRARIAPKGPQGIGSEGQS